MKRSTCSSCIRKLHRLFDSNETTKLGFQDDVEFLKSGVSRHTTDYDADNENNDLSDDDVENSREKTEPKHAHCTPPRNASARLSAVSDDETSDVEDPVFETEPEVETPGTEIETLLSSPPNNATNNEIHVATPIKAESPELSPLVVPNVESSNDVRELLACLDGPNIRRLDEFRDRANQAIIPFTEKGCAEYISELKMPLKKSQKTEKMIYIGYDRDDPQLQGYIKIGVADSPDQRYYSESKCARGLQMFFFSPMGGETFFAAKKLERILQLIFHKSRRRIINCIYCRCPSDEKTTEHCEWFQIRQETVLPVLYGFKAMLETNELYTKDGQVTPKFEKWLDRYTSPEAVIESMIAFGFTAASVSSTATNNAIEIELRQISIDPNCSKMRSAIQRAQDYKDSLNESSASPVRKNTGADIPLPPLEDKLSPSVARIIKSEPSDTQHTSKFSLISMPDRKEAVVKLLFASNASNASRSALMAEEVAKGETVQEDNTPGETMPGDVVQGEIVREGDVKEKALKEEDTEEDSKGKAVTKEDTEEEEVKEEKVTELCDDVARKSSSLGSALAEILFSIF